MDIQDTQEKRDEARAARLAQYVKDYGELLEQDEVNYERNSPGPNACADCRFFRGRWQECVIVKSDYGAHPILATGVCDRHEELPVEESPVDEIADGLHAIADVLPGFFNGDERATRAPEPSGVIGAIKRGVQRLRGSGAEALETFKALGNGYWYAAYSGNYRDREGEYISEKAHQRYLSRVYKGLVDLPELWFMHSKGTRHGKALLVWWQGHSMFAVGKFDDNAIGRAMEKAYTDAEPGRFTLSHGFYYPEWAKKGDTWEDYNTFEITVIDTKHGQAAYPYTEFWAVNREQEIKQMALNKRVREALLENVPEDIVAEIEARADKQVDGDKGLEELETSYKDFVAPDEELEQEDKEDEAADKALPGEGEALGFILEEQLAQAEKIDRLTAVAQGTLTALNKITGERDEALKELAAIKADKPRRVADAEPSNVDEDTAAKANEDLDDMEDAAKDTNSVFPMFDALSKNSDNVAPR